jgi:tetratricopeptide (TPR) repeat protein/transglutaminase-like putative cysteine protease
MPRRLGTLLFCIVLSGFLPGQNPTSPPAKADTTGEAFVFERISELVRFESDGTGVRDTTAVIRVQNQAGMQQFGQLVFGYSSATERLDLDYVRVRKPDGQVVVTPAANAQDFAPEILRDAPMYSDYRQRHVSVVDLHPGDVLEYHAVIHVTTPLAANEFWYEHSFPRHVAIGEDRLEVDLPKSREVKLKSPDRKYEVHENGDRRVYVWTLRDVVPDRKHEREGDDFDTSDDQPDIQISTFADWVQVAHWYAKLQGDRVVVDDRVRRKAAELTRGAVAPLEKTRRLYDYVAGSVRYVSLSFGVGRLQPHAASEVLQNGFGDCKDKHTLLQALLRAADITSYPVLINSGRKLDPDVPSPAQFDHEITAVRLGKGEDLTWLDTTAEVAPFGLIMYQLRNKQSLLASDDTYAGLRKTTADSPVKNLVAIKIDGKFSETGALDTTFDLLAQGDSDLPLRMAFRRAPPADWQRVLQFFSAVWGFPGGDVSEVHFDSLEDTSKPLHLTFHLHKENFFIVPTSGANFGVLPPIAVPGLPRFNPRKGPQPLDVGPSVEQTYRAHIQFPATYSVSAPGAVRMARDYGEYSSSYTLTKNVLDAERHLVLKVNELPPARRADYESFRNVSSSSEQQVLNCSIAPASAAAVALAGKASGTADELRKAGKAALERKDFGSAADLLKRSLDKDSSQKDVWEDLGLAYAALHRHDEAINAFRKQIDADAFHARAHGDLASELQQQAKFEEAIAAYRKQTEITPGDKSAHKSLGLLLLQTQQESEALTELETAASIPPDDPEVKIALARLYAKNGNTKKAEDLMKSVTGVASLTSGPDLYAASLRDDINPSQTERDARKTLNNIGEEFDAGEFDRLGPSAFSAMNLVALAWARIGWARFLQGEMMEAMQYLNSSWILSQSGTVGNRLARLLEKEGQRDQARRMYALAVAAGGAEEQASRQAVVRLSASTTAAEQEIAQAAVELHSARTVSLPAIAPGTVSANFVLVFDSSRRPERADFLDGDPTLSAARAQLQEKDYPLKFPDVSSVKLIRRAKVSCSNSKCSLELLPAESMIAGEGPRAAAATR